MKKIRNYFLEPYGSAGIILQEKARLLAGLSLVIMFVAEPLLIVIQLLFGDSFNSIYSLVLFCFCGLSLFFLRKGRYGVAANIILTCHFVVLWAAAFICFLQRKDLIIISIPLFFIILIMVILPMLILRRTLPIVIYLFANIVLMAVYFIIIKSEYSVNDSFYGYISGIAACMLLTGIVSVLNFKTSNRILFLFKKARKEIEEQRDVLNDSKNQFEAINRVLLQSQKEIKQTAEKYRVLYDNALVGMLTIDEPSGNILRLNKRAADMFALSNTGSMEGANIRKYYYDAESRRMLLTELFFRGEIQSYELKLRKADESVFWAEISAKYFKDEEITEVVLTDITDKKMTEENIHRLTYYDTLTELPNRRMLVERLNQEISKTDRKNRVVLFAVMCIGIDRFKNINDMYGPMVGDSLLKVISNRLRHVIRDDDFLSKMEGDKFSILFSEIDSTNGVLGIIKKISTVMEKPFAIASEEIVITNSTGVCFYPNDAVSPDELITCSEAAMFTAKERGRNTYHLYDAGLNEELLANLNLEKDLRNAIFLNQFIPFFQPKVDSAGNIIGAEALVRWLSPERGLVSPGEFIPLAEKNGMITEIGKLILRETSVIVKKWYDMGLVNFRVSVNISPAQFKDPLLIDAIRDIVDYTSVPPLLLDLEITETGIMENERESIEKLSLIQKMGITVSIDDFGTGYSSLSKLRDYPVDILKIDKTFIDNLPEDVRSGKIAVSIIELAHNLGFTVVGEGVEKKEQVDFLEKYNCDQYQGFYFSRPLPSDEFEQLLLNQNNKLHKRK